MNRALKETLTKLVLETYRKDYAALFPFALFWVWNTTGKFKLTPFELLHGTLPLLTEAGEMFDPDVPFSQPLLAHLKALQLVRKDALEMLKHNKKQKQKQKNKKTKQKSPTETQW